MPKSPCAPGETRNKHTRKCRSKKRPGRRAKTPCAPGQTRNRVTKKCRDKKRRGPAPKPVEPKTYRADLFEEVDGKFKRRSTEHFIQIDDESNNLFDTCTDRILEMIRSKVAPSKGFFDIQTFPEDSYVTIMSDIPIPEKMLRVLHTGALPAHCTRNKVGFQISSL